MVGVCAAAWEEECQGRSFPAVSFNLLYPRLLKNPTPNTHTQIHRHSSTPINTDLILSYTIAVNTQILYTTLPPPKGAKAPHAQVEVSEWRSKTVPDFSFGSTLFLKLKSNSKQCVCSNDACTNHFSEAFSWVKRDKSQNLLMEYAASSAAVRERSMSPDICYAVVTGNLNPH